MSTVLEISGFMALVVGIYLLAGLATGLIAFGLVLLFLGYATTGLRLTIPHRRKPEPKRKKRPLEALTNAEFDQLTAAQLDLT